MVANAFFVAAEFALVGARRSRIDELARQGAGSARAAQRVLRQLDRYISATQLGITLASLALGWIGEPAIAGLLHRVLLIFGSGASAAVIETGASVIIAFLIITFLHIVLGELAPKSLALAKPEGVSLWVARPLSWFAALMSPAIWLLNSASTAMLRMVGMRPASESERVHSPEELRLLVMQSRAHGALDESDTAMIAGVFDFHDKKARDVMRPRTEIVAIPSDAGEQELRALLRRERYSRYPVYDDTLDDVIGVFLAKDLWLEEPDERRSFELARYVREVLYVPDSRPAERVLDDLRRTRAQMAVVLDEYGGTAGILTLEDLVEEVIGDIADEYDAATRDSIELDGVLELAGSLSLVDVRRDYRVGIPEGEWTTLGGYTFARLGRLPHVGDRVTFPGGELEVVAMDGRRVAAVRVIRSPAARAAGAEADART
ncbi:MAG: HlyC/CorC family transporter [Gemmatimonadaceae bacterium]|nr:HlyC/CorC family transporter [Gemmatimonadaceae bacterium]NUQ91312.1 HlyC/CorC family transporter [Gemmatimonadaceae bacterium]NUS97810.1 HlyC/CorC family transporter [Gemmatimonadaceae bacterium]